MKRVNNFNDDYFEKIDSEDKAYFLGLLFADGNVYIKRNRVQLTLANKDAYIIHKFAEYINYYGKIYFDRKIYSKIILPSKKMCEDLIALGCTPNKSLTLTFPELIPEEYLHHFIRGCFDGDGHISKRGNCFNINFTGSETFVKSFTKLLDSMQIEYTSPIKRYPEKEKSAYQLYIKSKSARDFINYIYKEATIFLKRKKEIADLEKICKKIKVCKICQEKYFAKNFCRKHYLKNYHNLKKNICEY